MKTTKKMAHDLSREPWQCAVCAFASSNGVDAPGHDSQYTQTSLVAQPTTLRDQESALLHRSHLISFRLKNSHAHACAQLHSYWIVVVQEDADLYATCGDRFRWLRKSTTTTRAAGSHDGYGMAGHRVVQLNAHLNPFSHEAPGMSSTPAKVSHRKTLAGRLDSYRAAVQNLKIVASSFDQRFKTP